MYRVRSLPGQQVLPVRQSSKKTAKSFTPENFEHEAHEDIIGTFDAYSVDTRRSSSNSESSASSNAGDTYGSSSLYSVASSYTANETVADSIYQSNDEKDHVLTIDSDRLWSDIMSTSTWGGLADQPGGMSRLALTDEDKSVRDWFREQAEELGCTVTVDSMGNIFAVLAGENSDVPPIGIGSHLDTQPAGGRFDGILGVIGGLEVLRTIKESGIKPYASVTAIDWTNE